MSRPQQMCLTPKGVTPKWWLQREPGGGRCHHTEKHPPWYRDGYKLYGHMENVQHDEPAHIKWGLANTDKVPLVVWVADFYTLDAIITQVPQHNLYIPKFSGETMVEFVHKGMIPKGADTNELTSLWALYLQTLLVNKLAPLIRNYLFFACAGEAAHHYHTNQYFGASEEGMRHTALTMIERFGPIQTATWLSQLFHQKNKEGGNAWWGKYGGELWGIAADQIVYYETGKIGDEPYTPKNLCDRSFALQHNGGTIFSKMGWAGYNWHEKLPVVLDAHANGNYDILLKRCTPVVQSAWSQAQEPSESFKYDWGIHYPRLLNEPEPDDDEEEGYYSCGCCTCCGCSCGEGNDQ